MAKRFGFTLAEVLITLGIIGVVAAMTIPTLISNTKGAQYRSQFKKTLSTLNQAARMSQAQYDFNFGGAMDCSENAASENPNSVMTMCSLLNGTLTGYSYLGTLNDIKMPSGSKQPTYAKTIEANAVGLFSSAVPGSFANGGGLAYSLADGSMFVFSNNSDYYNDPVNHTPKRCVSDPTMTKGQWNDWYGQRNCSGFIDVNGTAGPNKEVMCVDRDDTYYLNDTAQPCTVDNTSIGDIIPVVFYDGTVEPYSNAAQYLLNSSK